MALFWSAIPWMAGILLAKVTTLTLWQWLFLAALSFSGVWLARQPHLRLVHLGVLLLCLGATRLSLNQRIIPAQHIAHLNDDEDPLILYGIICADPQRRASSVRAELCVQRARLSNETISHNAEGRVLLYTHRETDLSYGDRVRTFGHLSTPPSFETFSYADYLARQDIYSLMGNASVTVLDSGHGHCLLRSLYQLRRSSHQVLLAILPDPEASLLSGILLGVEVGIPLAVQEAFNQTGTTHIIAISGFNITIIAGFVITAFGRLFGRTRGMLAACLVILLYTLLVGADAAVVRAAIMGLLTLYARLLGRRTYAFASLAASVYIMTLIDPYLLWDAGFQLSFAATLGLILYADPLTDHFIRVGSRWLGEKGAQRAAGPVGDYILMTFAAQLTTLPLTMMLFQRFSLSSFFVNPLILPVQPAIMMGGGAALLGGLAWNPLGKILAAPVWILLAYTIRIVEWCARLPFGSFPTSPNAAHLALLYYVLLLGTTCYLRLPPEKRPLQVFVERCRSAITIPVWSLLAGLSMATAFVWRTAAARPDGLLHITVFPAGNGDMALITTPDGRSLLIDGGPSTVDLADALGRRLPPWNRELDAVILAGTRPEQLQGLVDITERFQIHQVLHPTRMWGNLSKALLEEFQQEGIPVHTLDEELCIQRGSFLIEIVSSGQHGAAVLLSYDAFQLLMLPGITPGEAETLSGIPRLADMTAVLLADSGYDATNPDCLLEHLHPHIAIISTQAAASNSPFHTGSAALGPNGLRTDELGWIELITDGQRLWVLTEYPPATP